jgi:lysophospholipase L1-like esterase
VLSLVAAVPTDVLAARNTTSLRILPLGDSITWGYIWLNEHGGGSNGYRASLLVSLQAAGYTVDFVGSQKTGTMTDKDNEGHRGYTINQIRTVAGGGLAYRPNVVLLHAGTNDLNRANPPEESDSDAPGRLGVLLDDVLREVPDAVVIVAKIIPTRDPGVTAKVKTFNNALPAMVAERVANGSKVTIVDMSVLRPDELCDKLHP